MSARTLGLSLLLGAACLQALPLGDALGPRSARAQTILLDRQPVKPATTRKTGHGGRTSRWRFHVVTPQLREAGGRWSPPVAWRLDELGDSAEVTLDVGLTAELLASLPLDSRTLLLDELGKLASTLTDAPELLPLEPELTDRILNHQAGPVPGPTASARVRWLTRGHVRDRWKVPEKISLLLDPPAVDPSADTAPATTWRGHAPEDLPDHLLLVELVAGGLHREGSGHALPSPLAHVTLRARLFEMKSGNRLWDRSLLMGESLIPGLSEQPDLFAVAWDSLLRGGLRQLLSGYWTELAPAAVPDDPATSTGTAVGTNVGSVTGADGSPISAAVPLPTELRTAGLDELLARLVKERLRVEVDPGEAWSMLAAACRNDIRPAWAAVLACAADPEMAAAELGSHRLGVGLAEARTRLQRSRAFRSVLAGDLAEEVTRARGGDDLRAAAEHLLAGLRGETPDAGAATTVAAPLLRRARGGALGTSEEVAARLIGAPIEPSGALRDAAAVLATQPGGDPRP
ncbi:MAG: hypothetical protein AAF533_30010 [Acidobacteriota bacterium]